MQSYQNMSDEELIAALRSGEKDITEYLLDKYKSLVKKKANALGPEIFCIHGNHEMRP